VPIAIATGDKQVHDHGLEFPGMNAMAMLYDHVSYSMNFDPVTNVWTIVPATAVTYCGTGAPAEDQIRKAAEDKKS
jgi:hypothetical protein